MKKLIGGRRYDTDGARALGSASYGSRGDLGFWEETLYRKRTGEFFLYGEGGAMTRYARATGQSQWSPGEEIFPLTVESAKEWAEKNLDADEYEEIFGVSEERHTVTYSLSEAVIEKISQLAAQHGCSKSEIVERAITRL